MNVSQIKHRNIRLLVAAAGGPAAFSRLTKNRWKPAQISQWQSESNPKPIGRKIMKDLEREVGLRADSLERLSFLIENARLFTKDENGHSSVDPEGSGVDVLENEMADPEAYIEQIREMRSPDYDILINDRISDREKSETVLERAIRDAINRKSLSTTAMRIITELVHELSNHT